MMEINYALDLLSKSGKYIVSESLLDTKSVREKLCREFDSPEEFAAAFAEMFKTHFSEIYRLAEDRIEADLRDKGYHKDGDYWVDRYGAAEFKSFETYLREMDELKDDLEETIKYYEFTSLDELLDDYVENAYI